MSILLFVQVNEKANCFFLLAQKLCMSPHLLFLWLALFCTTQTLIPMTSSSPIKLRPFNRNLSVMYGSNWKNKIIKIQTIGVNKTVEEGLFNMTEWKWPKWYFTRWPTIFQHDRMWWNLQALIWPKLKIQWSPSTQLWVNIHIFLFTQMCKYIYKYSK